MAEKIGFTKEQLHSIYDQVTSQPGSGARNETTTGAALGSATAGTTASSHDPSLGSAIAPALGSRNEDGTGVAALGARNDMTASLDLTPRTGRTLDPNAAPRTEVGAATGIGSRDQVASTESKILPGSEPSATSDLAYREKSAKGSNVAPATGVVAGTAIGHRDNVISDPKTAPRNETTTTSDLAHPDKSTKDSKVAPAAGAAAAADFGNHNESRRDSDVGPRNEATPEHHHHHHKDKKEHHKDKPSDHHTKSNDPKAATGATTHIENNANGLNYGDVSHLGVSSNPSSSGPRRQSLADSPYRGNIDTTVSPPTPEKKWSFSMGDFGLKLPKQESNAVTQHLQKDGSVSMQGGQGRVPRGIGSISSTVKRGSVDATASPRDPAKKWSLGHGDFGLKFPKQESNAVAQELNRDGSVSSQGGLGPGGAAAGQGEGSGARAGSLGRQGARGIGSISSSVRRGSVDVTVSDHDKHRKWSLKDADFGLKWPKQPSNLHE